MTVTLGALLLLASPALVSWVWVSPVLASPQVVGAGAGWAWVDATAAAGFQHVHGFRPEDLLTEPHWMSGGVAAGDVDGDGWVDLYVVRGTLGPGLLYRNQGDGTFEDIAAAAGLVAGGAGDVLSGPALADLDGDGDLDLLVGGVAGAGPRLFENLLGDPSCGAPTCFVERTGSSGLFATADTFSSAFGDVDRDGDLDLFMAHWSGTVPGGLPSPHLWRNDGDLRFAPIDFSSGVVEPYRAIDWSFTPAFPDLDGDGWVDLVVAGDFGRSEVFRNVTATTGSIRFEVATTPAIDDENGMGSAVADFDGDGDVDWLVTAIWDPDGINEGNWGVSGNRLYRNDSTPGSIELVDVTEEAGVRRGYWGWGACAADFDLDGWLDVAHVNGFQALGALPEFGEDPARLFLGVGDGRFLEASAAHGLDHTGQGRGIVCFDADRDGDIDLFVASNGGPPTYYRNDLDPGDAGPAWLGLRLLDRAGAPAVGATVTVIVEPEGGAPRRHTRRVDADSNYLSQNPAEVHVGLGDLPPGASSRIEVVWPDGTFESLDTIALGVWSTVRRGDGPPPPPAIPSLSSLGLALSTLLLGLAALWRLRARQRRGVNASA